MTDKLMRPIDRAAESEEMVWEPQGRWWVGKMNLREEVARDLILPAKVVVVDATLREGEEVPDTVLSEEQKLELAFAIFEAGFREFEVGYAGVIEEHFALVRRLRREGFQGTLASHTRIYGRPDEWRREIDRNLEAGVQILTMVGWASEVGTATTPWLPKPAVAERVAECVAYARAQGAVVTFGLADLVRTSVDQITACYRAAASAGANRVYVYDGVGAARPDTVRFLTHFLREVTGAGPEIAVHVHDTFGLAQANAVAALTSGASVVDAVPLGLGDGAGITASEEIAPAMEVLYGVPTGIDLARLRSLCERVAGAFRIPLPQTKAVVGPNLYTHQIDSHVAAILRGAWYSWEVARPEVLGHTRRLAFGHAKLRDGRSGAVAALLERMGVEATDDQLREVIAALRAETQRRPSLDIEQAEAVVRGVLDKAGGQTGRLRGQR